MIYDWGGFAIMVYLAVAVLTFFVNMNLTRSMTPALALLRALVWPLWWATGRPGKPEGQRYG